MKSRPLNPINHICDCSRRRAVPAPHDARGRRVALAAGHATTAARNATAAGGASAGGSAPARSLSGRGRPAEAACKVDASAQGGGSDTRRHGRDSTGATGTAGAPEAAETVTPADDAVRQEIRRGTRPADRMADRMTGRRTRSATPARGSGIPLPVRGAQRGARRDARRAVRAPHWRRIGKGQRAFFPADGTGAQTICGIAPLSLCESPIRAQDLLMTTCGSLGCT
jgi:hypothetical protein